MFHRHFILEENFEKRSGQAEISLVSIFWTKYFNCSLQNVIYSILFYFSLVLVFGVEMFYFCDIRYLYPHLKYTIYKKTEIIRKWVIWNTWIKPMFFSTLSLQTFMKFFIFHPLFVSKPHLRHSNPIQNKTYPLHTALSISPKQSGLQEYGHTALFPCSLGVFYEL